MAKASAIEPVWIKRCIGDGESICRVDFVNKKDAISQWNVSSKVKDASWGLNCTCQNTSWDTTFWIVTSILNKTFMVSL